MDSACLRDTQELTLPLEITLDQSATATLNNSHTPRSCRGLMMDLFRSLQSGQTLESWMEQNLEVWLMLLREGSHVKIYPLQARVKDWQESVQDFLEKSLESHKNHPLHSSSLKTCLQLEQEDLSRFKKHWPPSGMILDGVLYPLPKLGPIIEEKDGSVWPTPRAAMTGSVTPERTLDKFNNLESVLARKMFPTPTAQDFKRRGPNSAQQGLSNTEHFTPNGGPLNPTWVEWLMGLPLGWTELRPWVMEWFLSRSKRRLKH